MRTPSWMKIVLCLMLFTAPAMAEPEIVSAPDGCPSVTHVPMGTVMRGTPAEVAATITCEAGSVGPVRLFVRLSDVNKPVSTEMAGQGDGVYSATIPVSMFAGITRFWYYVDARGKADPSQSDESVVQTRWYPVTILDAQEAEKGTGKEEDSFKRRAVFWVLGGAAAIAGGAAIYDHNHGHSTGGGTTEQPPTPPPAPAPADDSDEDDEEEEESDDDSSPEPPACVTSGTETVELANTLPCVSSQDIEIRVCNACPNAILTAAGSWGATDQFIGYNEEGCGTATPAMTLAKPTTTVNYPVGYFTITVSANGQLIATIPWPSTDDELMCR